MPPNETLPNETLPNEMLPNETPPNEMLPPAGIRLVADTALDRRDSGRLLIGGAPLRIIRLSDAGAKIFGEWLNGEPLADTGQARRLARRMLDAGIVHPVVAPVTDRDLTDTTVVIPAYNDADGLARCLGSLGDLPVIVVDDASDNSAEIAALCEQHGAQLIRHHVNGGPGAARNTGLAAATTSLVAFVDTDVELWPGWLNHLVGHFEDLRVAAVAPRIRSRPGDSPLERYEQDRSPLDLGDRRALVAPRNPLSYVPAAVLVTRVDAISEIGGFDAEIRTGEDVDLVWRLVAGGGLVRYDPAVNVEHRPRESWRALLEQRRSYGSSAANLGARHGSCVAPARCSRWSAAAWGAAAVGHPLVGLGAAAGSAAALKRKLGPLPDSLAVTVRLAGTGHLHAGYGIARAVARVWWPLAVLIALTRPRARPLVVAAMLGPSLLDWIRGLRPSGLIRTLALRLADDLAYGAGVWQGVVCTRDATSLIPEFSDPRIPSGIHANRRGLKSGELSESAATG